MLKVIAIKASMSQAVIEEDGEEFIITMMRHISMDKPNPKSYYDFTYKVFINGKWQEIRPTKATKYC